MGGRAGIQFFRYLFGALRQKYSNEVEESLEKTGAQFETPEARQSYIDRRTFDYVYQNIQSFVFNLNVPSRWGNANPLHEYHARLDLPGRPERKKIVARGRVIRAKIFRTEKRKWISSIARFIEVMTAGDARGRVFTFPIPTYNITPDFDWEGENTDLLFEMTAKYGMPYFQNFINSDLQPGRRPLDVLPTTA